MNKKEKNLKNNDNSIHVGLIFEMYLLLDFIVLFILCMLEINTLSHSYTVFINFILEFLFMFYLIYRSNIKSGIIYYIVLLFSPIFLGLIAMTMSYVGGKDFFTPTVLTLFRNGYAIKGLATSSIINYFILFRISALLALLIWGVIKLINHNSKGK